MSLSRASSSAPVWNTNETGYTRESFISHSFSLESPYGAVLFMRDLETVSEKVKEKNRDLSQSIP